MNRQMIHDMCFGWGFTLHVGVNITINPNLLDLEIQGRYCSLDEYSKGHLERIFSDRQVCLWLTMAGKNQFAADIKQFCSLYGVGEVEIQMKFT